MTSRDVASERRRSLPPAAGIGYQYPLRDPERPDLHCQDREGMLSESLNQFGTFLHQSVKKKVFNRLTPETQHLSSTFMVERIGSTLHINITETISSMGEVALIRVHCLFPR